MEAPGARPATRTYRPRIRLPEGSPRTGQTRKQLALEVWPESHWPGFALRQADVFQSYTAW